MVSINEYRQKIRYSLKSALHRPEDTGTLTTTKDSKRLKFSSAKNIRIFPGFLPTFAEAN